MTQNDPQKLHMSSGRLEALGDGIFAVAMTLLIIEVSLPVVHSDSFWEVIRSLKETWIEFLCFGISFVVLGIMWYGHRMMFEYVGRSNRYFIFLGVLFYMVVCIVPFSTKFLAHEPLKWYTLTMYGLNLSLCNLSLYCQWSYAIRRPAFLSRELPAEVRKEARILFLISPAIYSLAIILSFFIPVVSIIIYCITPLLYLLPNKLDRYMP